MFVYWKVFGKKEIAGDRSLLQKLMKIVWKTYLNISIIVGWYLVRTLYMISYLVLEVVVLSVLIGKGLYLNADTI